MSRSRVRRHKRSGRMVREHSRQRTGYPTRRRLTRAEERLLDEWGGSYGGWE
jgi:hypothetical protein